MKTPWSISIPLLIITCGCANLNPSQDSSHRSFLLEKPRMPPTAVGIEVGVARIDASQASQLDQFLKSVDQQELTLETRKRLDRNGLRCGIMSTRAPAVFHKLLESYQPDPESVSVAAKPLAIAGKLAPTPRLLTHQRVSNQDGEVYPIGTSDLYQEVEWTLHEGNRDTSRSAKLARCFFNVTTFPNTDGSATLSVTPVIRHGAERTRIEVADGSFVLDRGQQRIKLDPLAFEVQLRVGETLVVSAISPFDVGNVNGAQPELGSTLLGCEEAGATHILLVRLIQTQMNDLFDRSLTSDRLSTASTFR